jgi:hypothetical protein
VCAIDAADRILWTVAFPRAPAGHGANLAIGPGRALVLTVGGVLQALVPGP